MCQPQLLPWLLVLVLSLTCAGMAAGEAAAPRRFFVSPQGRDSWSGRLAAPNRSKTDGPFATLEKARDAVRGLRRQGNLGGAGVTVWIRGGAYHRARPFDLTSEDGGTAKAPVTYAAYRQEKPRFLGGRTITAFRPVTDRQVIERLAPAARGKVMQSDLRAQGITDYGSLTPRGFGRPVTPAGLELFCQDRPMPLAGWPNQGWLKIVSAPAGQNGGKLTYEGDNPKRWASTEDVWIHGYWTYDWADTYERVASLDAERREVTTVPPHGAYGYTPGKRFRFLNVLEELDSPGEWYLDRDRGMLYFWPPTTGGRVTAVVSMLEEPLVRAKGVSHLAIRGLTLEACRGAALEVEGGSSVTIAGCTVRNTGTDGIRLRGASRCRVTGCDIYQTGEAGVILDGGDRKTLTPGRNVVEDCHIHHFSRWCRTYRPAVGISGVGNRVAHCLMHDAPHSAILLGGNDHVIELNEIHHVCTDTGDAGAFYMGRDFTQQGNVVRHNYFHHLTRTVESEGFVDVMAVYLDDCTSGTTVVGNLCYKAGRALMIGGGRDNVLENNVLVDCNPAVHVDARGKGWASFWFDGRDQTIMDRLKAMEHDRPPYSTRYPKLARYLEDDPAQPKGNRIARNVFFGGKWIELLDGLTEKDFDYRDNWTEGDPGFVAPEKGDFRLGPDSPVWKLGFRSIPVERIGLRTRRQQARAAEGSAAPAQRSSASKRP